MSWKTTIAALLGISTYAAAPVVAGPSLDSPRLQQARKAYGGQLAPLPITQTRWHTSDLESAEQLADMGDLSKAARLMRAARKDGSYSGVLSTRTGGLVRLPKKFRGRSDIVEDLELGHDSVRSVFDEMFPPAELALMAADGITLGVSVGILEPVEGRDYPVLVRLEPEFLIYRWNENRWYYQSVVGLLPITPGDGRWVLHTPGGRVSPWQNGLWRAIGQAWIAKQQAQLHKANWEGKLANPARVGRALRGDGDAQRQSWFRSVMAWGVNTVFGMLPGYDVKLLESNGIGFECFNSTIELSTRDMTIAIAGQVVSTDGGAGFSNSDIHRKISSDLIKDTADGLAYTINTQGIPPWVVARFGEDALEQSALVEWDVTPPKDRAAEANAMVAASNALKGLQEALAVHGRELDVDAFAVRFSIPIKGDANGDGKPDATVSRLPVAAQAGGETMQEAA
jgi:hypothetical protein